MKKIAWIGTGVMGYAMAAHLIEAGYPLNVYTRTASKAEGLRARLCFSIEEAVQEADIVITMVGYPQDVQEVYDAIFKYARRGTLCIDMTTSAPSLAQDLAIQAKKYGLNCLDAPVSGGDIGAKNATLTIMVGGDVQTYHEALPIFEKLGKTITYVGKAGSGQHCKMANQIVIAGNLVAVCESIQYAKKCGLDPQLVLSAISGGSAASWQLLNNGPKILQDNLSPGFYVHHFIKDLKLVLHEAHQVNLHLPVVEEVLKDYEALVEKDPTLALAGTQALIKSYE